MINTDKYEGHKGSLVHSISNEEWKKLSPAAQALIADAPLLLAEVIRLREENDTLGEAVKEDNEILKKHIETLAEVKRLREQLAKANKYVHTICQHSDSMLMDYEDYMKGDEEE